MHTALSICEKPKSCHLSNPVLLLSTWAVLYGPQFSLGHSAVCKTHNCFCVFLFCSCFVFFCSFFTTENPYMLFGGSGASLVSALSNMISKWQQRHIQARLLVTRQGVRKRDKLAHVSHNLMNPERNRVEIEDIDRTTNFFSHTSETRCQNKRQQQKTQTKTV